MVFTIAKDVGAKITLPPAPKPAITTTPVPSGQTNIFSQFATKVENSTATINRDAQNSFKTAQSIVVKTIAGATTKVQNSEATGVKLALNLQTKQVDSMNTLIKDAQNSSATAKKVLENSSATVKRDVGGAITKVENSGKTAMSDVGKAVNNSLQTIGKSAQTAASDILKPLGTDVLIFGGVALLLLFTLKGG